ncbi:MAG: hypothetical protein KGH87_05200 [Thaumarchaeota archaeon]|nr:hypothetical protein [Nitrososphaerota archaeon]MDE1839300.1 hypothetical protein [Nitrososphaerota archaeon]
MIDSSCLKTHPPDLISLKTGAVKLTVDFFSVKIRLIVQRIKKAIEERTTNYEITPEYDLKIREDGSYYYENEKGDIIEPSS